MSEQSEVRMADDETCRRCAEVCRLTQERLSRMSAAERDRLLQEHLAEAHTPEKRFEMLCRMTTTMLRLRCGAAQTMQAEGSDNGK
jgi:hypothetical protein